MTKLNWDNLRIFLATNRAGSLRGASEKLGVNHATVNRAIRNLEQTLGATIFERSISGLTLTQPGENLVEHAEEMERQSFQISRKIAGLDTKPSGIVRLTLPPSLAQSFLAPILASFSDAYPDIQVQVTSTNRITDLNRHEADVSIRVAREVDDDVVGRRLMQYVVCAYATPEYLENHPNLTIGDGIDANWIGWGGGASWVKSTPFPKARVTHSLPEILMQIEAAANGIGMAWVPVFLADSDPRLVRIQGAALKQDRSIWLLLHADLRKSARVRAFVDHTAAEIRRNIHKFTT